MFIVWASAFLSLSILFFGLAFQQFRRPNAPGWLVSDLSVQMICVVIVTFFAFGCTFVAKFVEARQTGDSSGLEYIAAFAALALAALAAGRLMALGRRQAAVVPASADVIQFTPPRMQGGDNPLRPVTPKRPRRRAA